MDQNSSAGNVRLADGEKTELNSRADLTDDEGSNGKEQQSDPNASAGRSQALYTTPRKAGPSQQPEPPQIPVHDVTTQTVLGGGSAGKMPRPILPITDEEYFRMRDKYSSLVEIMETQVDQIVRLEAEKGQLKADMQKMEQEVNKTRQDCDERVNEMEQNWSAEVQQYVKQLHEVQAKGKSEQLRMEREIEDLRMEKRTAEEALQALRERGGNADDCSVVTLDSGEGDMELETDSDGEDGSDDVEELIDGEPRTLYDDIDDGDEPVTVVPVGKNVLNRNPDKSVEIDELIDGEPNTLDDDDDNELVPVVRVGKRVLNRNLDTFSETDEEQEVGGKEETEQGHEAANKICRICKYDQDIEEGVHAGLCQGCLAALRRLHKAVMNRRYVPPERKCSEHADCFRKNMRKSDGRIYVCPHCRAKRLEEVGQWVPPTQ